MKLMKFGGSSVGTPELIRIVVSLIREAANTERAFVVISAFQGVTDQLIRVAQTAGNGQEWAQELHALHQKHRSFAGELFAESDRTEPHELIDQKFQELSGLLQGIFLLKECSPRALDAVMSFGEILSCSLIVLYGRSTGVPLFFVDARDLVATDATYGNARVDFLKTNEAFQRFFANKAGIPIITGFIARSPDGSTTTLGRSGSDYTASIIGAALDVSVIEIWTDVDGVLTCDPRVVPESFVLPKISYEEAMELSHFGAKVIHPQTVQPAVAKGIPLLIKNTLNPGAPGTLISRETTNHEVLVKGIAAIDECALITIQGALMVGTVGAAMRIFKAVASKKISVILISQGSSEYSVCLGVKGESLEFALEGLREEFSSEVASNLLTITVKEQQAIVGVVGDEMRGRPGVAGRLFQTLGSQKVNLNAIAQGGSERNISFVIDQDQKVRALKAIHEGFYVKEKVLRLFVVGVGGIGSTLLSQIQEHQGAFTQRGVRLDVCGIADSKQFIMDQSGIPLDRWQERLKASEQHIEFERFLQEAQKLQLFNTVFVDCTASEEVARAYPSIVRAGMHLVTPNKKANVLPYHDYQSLRELLLSEKKQFLYETNVGGGLPILTALGNLLKSGDEIVQVKALLSGTLSYLFTAFDGKAPFSQLVRGAKEQGITEPDPREDLSGHDVARKLLIIAREMGMKCEFSDIQVQNLVPEDCRSGSVEDFLSGMLMHDAEFESMRFEAEQSNSVLRYVAEFSASKLVVGLRRVPRDHAFARIRGTDNMVLFTTKRYSTNPLIIQGPGAGKEVTAAGVLADIVKLASYIG